MYGYKGVVMNNLITVVKQQFVIKNGLRPFFHTLSLLILITPVAVSADRFDPPSLSIPLQDFETRLDGNIFNVDFLLAHVIGNAKKTVRETGEIIDAAGAILGDTAVFTNIAVGQTGTGTTGANAGSVVIPAGTTADTIIVINEIDGDNIAIQR